MCESSATSSAKARSSRVDKRVHLMPRTQSDVDCRITQSIVKLKSNADIGHPCLTPVFTSKRDSLFPTLRLIKVVIEALDDKDDLLENSICPEYAP